MTLEEAMNILQKDSTENLRNSASTLLQNIAIITMILR